jgi:hypothetical protein
MSNQKEIAACHKGRKQGLVARRQGQNGSETIPICLQIQNEDIAQK